MAWRDYAESLSTMSRAHGTEWPPLGVGRWRPERAGRRVLILCLTDGPPGTGWTAFPTIEEARAAEIARGGRRCREACLHAHVVAYVAPGEIHIERGHLDPAPVPQSLADALAQAYPPIREIAHNGHRHRAKETDMAKETTVTEPTDDEAREIIAAERKAGRLLARIGVSRRAALAWREVADLRANGADAEAVDAAEMVAKALADAALAALDADGE